MDLNLGDTQAILRECERMGVLRNQAAYLLATTFLETGRTMKPITEYGQRSYFNKYEPGTKIGTVLGNKQPGDGYRFRGRGYVQITGRRNYAKASRETGVDLIADPEAALRPDVAAKALIAGSMQGWFTGKKIPDYITREASDYINARRVINGTDRAAEIARLAREYDAALFTAGYGTKPITPTAPNIFLTIINAFLKLLRGKK